MANCTLLLHPVSKLSWDSHWLFKGALRIVPYSHRSSEICVKWQTSTLQSISSIVKKWQDKLLDLEKFIFKAVIRNGTIYEKRVHCLTTHNCVILSARQDNTKIEQDYVHSLVSMTLVIRTFPSNQHISFDETHWTCVPWLMFYVLLYSKFLV